jgi:hypothetical protein
MSLAGKITPRHRSNAQNDRMVWTGSSLAFWLPYTAKTLFSCPRQTLWTTIGLKGVKAYIHAGKGGSLSFCAILDSSMAWLVNGNVFDTGTAFCSLTSSTTYGARWVRPGRRYILTRGGGYAHHPLYLFIAQDIFVRKMLYTAGIAVNATQVAAVGDRYAQIVYMAVKTIEDILSHSDLYSSTNI